MSISSKKPTSVFNQIDSGKIGKGRLFAEGSWKKTRGLKGQLGKIKKIGCRTTTKNLSKKNLEQIHDFVADRLKGKTAGGEAILSRRDRMDIMRESRKLMKIKGSGFTSEDRKDLMKIVGVLRKQGEEAVFQRSNNIDKTFNIDKTLPANQEFPAQNENAVFGNDVVGQPGNIVADAGHSFLQKNNRIPRGELSKNISKANFISMIRQTEQSDDGSDDEYNDEDKIIYNTIEEQREKERVENLVYGFFDAKGEVVNLDLPSSSANDEDVEAEETEETIGGNEGLEKAA